MYHTINKGYKMYILNEESEQKLDCITLLLTKNELTQLGGYIKQLLEKTPSSDHYHLTNEDYQKEITICVYDPEDIENFNSRIRNLIKKDE